MEVTIIVFVVMSLLGSLMWMMPSKREKLLATLRLDARKAGFTVQLVHVEPPRAEGEYESDTINVAAYRMSRNNSHKKQPETVPWQVFRVKAISCDGLTEGWSWKIGERMLSSSHLAVLNEVIKALPDDVVGLESTPIHVSAYWKELSGIESMEIIKNVLEKLKKANL